MCVTIIGCADFFTGFSNVNNRNISRVRLISARNSTKVNSRDEECIYIYDWPRSNDIPSGQLSDVIIPRRQGAWHSSHLGTCNISCSTI